MGTRLQISVNITAVPHPKHQHFEFSIIDLVKNAIIAYLDPIASFNALYRPYSAGTRISYQRLDLFPDATLYGGGEFRYIFLGVAFNSDLIMFFGHWQFSPGAL